MDKATALDQMFVSKILPKIRGTDSDELKEALEGLKTLAEGQGLQNTARHLKRMMEDRKSKGFVKFSPLS